MLDTPPAFGFDTFSFFLSAFFERNGLKVFIGGVLLVFLFVMIHYVRAIIAWRQDKLGFRFGQALPGPEPAFPIYFFGQSFLDLFSIAIHAARTFFQSFFRLFNLHPREHMDWVDYIRRFFNILIGLAALGGIVFIAPLFLLLVLLHLLVVLVVSALAFLMMLFLRTAESVSFYLDPARVICPHPGCHQPVRRPHYLCPNCGAVHKKLRPGRFGLFYRRCACQKARIPTLDILGRKDLEGICPHCSRNHDVRWLNAGTRSVSLVGGGYSGKTHFGLMAIQAFLREGGKAGQSLELLPIASNEAYQRGTALLNKGLALSEADVSGNLAFAVAREDYQRGSGALLVEDPGSDAYGDLITTARARLAPHADGYLFLIDPFSIREVSANFQQQITHLAGTIYPASDPPMLVYQRFRKAIHIAEKPGNLPRPIAVVVTKSDALALIAEGGAGFDLSNSLHPGSRPGTIRQWLIDQGEGNLVRTLESDFSEVSYFCASALGQLPDTGRPAQPAGVLAPLAWLLRSWNDAEGYLPGTNFWHKVPVRFAIGMLSALLLFGALGWGGGAIAGRYLQADQLAWAGEATEKFMGWIQDVEGMADQAIAEFSGPMGGFRFVRPYKGLNLRASPDANGALIKSLPRGTALVLKTDSTRRILRQDNWVSVATNFGDAGWVYAGPGWRNLALRDPASLRFRGDEKPEGPPEKDIREAITQYYKQLAERKGERELRTISQVKVLSAGEDRVEVEVRLVERDLASGEISLEKRDFELIEKEGWWVTKMR